MSTEPGKSIITYRAGAGLIGFDRGPVHATSINNGPMYMISVGALADISAAAGYPVARPPEAPEFPDIQMQQIAGGIVLVARDRRRRFEGRLPVQSGALEHPRHGGWPAHLLTDLPIDAAFALQGYDPLSGEAV